MKKTKKKVSKAGKKAVRKAKVIVKKHSRLASKKKKVSKVAKLKQLALTKPVKEKKWWQFGK